MTRPELAPTPLMMSPGWCWEPAGIMHPKARSIHRLSGSSCGAAAFTWPRHSILRCSTAAARTGRSAPVMAGARVSARPNSTALRSSWSRSQNTSAGSAMMPEPTSRCPSSSSIRRISGQASPTSASASSRTGAARLRPPQQPDERGPAARARAWRRSARLRSSRRSADRCWRSCGSCALPAQVELQRLQQGGRIVGRHRADEVQVVDGMAEPVQMLAGSACAIAATAPRPRRQAGPPCGPTRRAPAGPLT